MKMSKDEILELGVGQTNNPFSEILLNGKRNALKESLEKVGWKDTNNNSFDVKVLFNDVEISAVDFNTIVGSWWDRMEDKIRKDLEYMKQEEAVNDKAKILLEDKLDNLSNILDEFRNSLDEH